MTRTATINDKKYIYIGGNYVPEPEWFSDEDILPPPTCPSIDEVIKEVGEAYRICRKNYKETDPDKLRECIDEIETCLSDIETSMEMIRLMNERLRNIAERRA